jgi:hypothetical protein
MVQGYERVEESLEALLGFAENNFEVNSSIAKSIRDTLST